MTRLLLLLVLILWPEAVPGAPLAIETPPGLREGGKGLVARVVDGDSVVLADGRRVRLVGLQAPKLPLGRPGFTPWPLAEEAKAVLEPLVLDREVRLFFGGREQDRHGRILAHLARLEDGLWVQGAMLSKGMARVYSFADNRAVVAEMLALEREARAVSRGIWEHPFYAVRVPVDLDDLIGTFQVVEGRVLRVSQARGAYYLDFTEDWRRGFSARIAPEAQTLFREAGASVKDLEGRTVRLRGWVARLNGPRIDITHPEQIELFR